MLRDPAIALSLANLCFIDLWSRLLDPSYRFYVKYPPSAAKLAAALLGVVLLGALVWGALTLARRAPKEVFGSLALGVVLLALLAALVSILSHVFVFWGYCLGWF